MSDDDRIDAKLSALLGGPDPEPDARFVARVERAVLAEQRLQTARRSAWRRFWREMAASGAVVLAFSLLWKVVPTIAVEALPIAPAMAAVSLLALWFMVELRPAMTGR